MLRSLALAFVSHFWLLIVVWWVFVTGRNPPVLPQACPTPAVEIDGREPTDIYRPIRPEGRHP